MIESVVSGLTYFIVFVGLYFSFFWILIILNREQESKKETFFPSVSVLIPAYNEELGIEKTIKSCLKLSYPGKLKIYVVNDASTDNTVKVAKKYEDKIIIVDKKKNAGKAAALNYTLKQIKTDYFAVVDADSEVSGHSLRKAIQHFKREDNEKVGAVVSKMKPSNITTFLERVQLMEYLLVGLIRSLSATIRLLHLTPGVLSIYDTKLVKKLGGFDSKCLTEDFEIAVRLRSEGYLVEYAPESDVFTKTPNKFKVFLKQRIRWSRGFIQVHTKHRKLFFNKKQGLFGLYQMPMNILGPVLFFLAVFAISFKIYLKLYEFTYKVFNTPDLIAFFDYDSIKVFLLGLDPKIDFLIVMSLLLVVLYFWAIMKFYKFNLFKQQPFKKIWALILYIMVYNYIYIYVWIVALIKEIQNKGYDWGTK